MEESDTLKEIVDKIYKINQSITEETISNADKKQLREYLILVDKLKARLKVILEEKL